jgi:hypothetical protein
MQELREEGATVAQIALYLKRSVGSVRARLRQLGVTRTRQPSELEQALLRPHTIALLAMLFGVRPNTVSRAKWNLRCLGANPYMLRRRRMNQINQAAGLESKG